jgi:glycosyltransferase involved in cell wall biosynthesis
MPKNSLLLINNSYPTSKFPNASTFIVAIEEALVEAGLNVDKLLIKRISNNVIIKVWQHFLFGIKLFFRCFNRYEYVYINHYTYIFFPLVCKMFFYGGRALFHWHGSDVVGKSFREKFVRFLMSKTFKAKDVHIAPSIYFKRLLCDQFNVDSNLVYISPSGGVNTKLFSPVCSEKRSDILNIGFPSGLIESKGVALLYSLKGDIPELEVKLKRKIMVHYIQYGGGHEYWDEKFKLVAEERIVKYKPMPKNEMPCFYNNIDILLMLSKHESLGLVVLEAMSCNVPVIARDICAMPEFVIPNVTGELIPPRASLNELENAIIKIFNGLSSYNPRLKILDEYGFNSIVQEYKTILNL